MSDRSPPYSYYSRLAPFQRLFEEGSPVLTYHKFGPGPRRARLRGLYLGCGLFQSQLTELQQAGYSTVPVEEIAQKPIGSAVALTIDDGFRSVQERALPLLKSRGMQATLYLVADRIGKWNDWEMAEGELLEPLMDEEGVREWISAGQRIGAHSLTHPWLTRIQYARAREEVASSRRRLEDLFGVPVTDFCYPFGDWNPAIRRLVEEAGYRTAATTDFGVNGDGTDLLALRRITARRPSRGWRSLRAWWRRWSGSGRKRRE